MTPRGVPDSNSLIPFPKCNHSRILQGYSLLQNRDLALLVGCQPKFGPQAFSQPLTRVARHTRHHGEPQASGQEPKPCPPLKERPLVAEKPVLFQGAACSLSQVAGVLTPGEVSVKDAGDSPPSPRVWAIHIPLQPRFSGVW